MGEGQEEAKQKVMGRKLNKHNKIKVSNIPNTFFWRSRIILIVLHKPPHFIIVKITPSHS